MKYINDEITFTSSKELFTGTFLEDGVMYSECNRRLLDGFINHVEIIDSYLGDKYGIDDIITLTVLKTEVDKIPAPYSINMIYDTNGLLKQDNYRESIKFNTIEEYVNARNLIKPDIHTKLGVYTEELILGKAEKLDNIYVLFWYSKTRNCSILRFETTDDIEIIKTELKQYIDNIEFDTVHRLNTSAYNGWLQSI